MALSVTSSNDIKVYSLTTGKSTPQWETAALKKRQSLRYNTDYRRRLDLIQDFEFSSASHHIQLTDDGAYIGVSGVYAPKLKVFELSQLGLKFERQLDSEIVTFAFISPDFRKAALLREDRTVELHAAYGKHHTVRIPRFGRAMVYDPRYARLCITAQHDEVFALNLELGQFVPPYRAVGADDGCDCIALSPAHPLMAVGRAHQARVDVVDTRTLTHITDLITPPPQSASSDLSISALAFDDDGMTLGVGTSDGRVLLYDIRSSRPVMTKDHRYEYPIHSIIFHQNTQNHRNVISADRKVIRIWSRDTGDVVTAVEPTADTHQVISMSKTSGLLMATGEQSRVQVYYIPAIGTAPSWCSFIDSMCEELEESKTQTVYDDYTFVTREQLERMSVADQMIGTNTLRPYMHGFFMLTKLYRKLQVAADPLQYETYVAAAAVAAIDKKAKDRIIRRKSDIKVNELYARALIMEKAKSKVSAPTPLTDERFKQMFQDEAFAMEDNEEAANTHGAKRLHSLSLKRRRVDADSDDEDEHGDRDGEIDANEEDDIEDDDDERANDDDILRDDDDDDDDESDNEVSSDDDERNQTVARRLQPLPRAFPPHSNNQAQRNATSNLTFAQRIAQAESQSQTETADRSSLRGRSRGGSRGHRGGRGGRDRVGRDNGDDRVHRGDDRRSMRALIGSDRSGRGIAHQRGRGRGRGGRGGVSQRGRNRGR